MSFKRVYILRGVPGSGKSTYIEKIAKSLDEQFPMDIQVCSADHFFESCDCDIDHIVSYYDPYDKDGFKKMKQQVRESHNRECIRPKTYKFDFNKLGAAHQACQDKYIRLLESPESAIIFVDNTNLSIKELKFYVGHAIGINTPENQIEYKIVNIRADIDKIVGRNVHGVPEDKVRQMYARMRHGDEELAKLDWIQEDYYSE